MLDGTDCNDGDARVWGTPGEVRDLRFVDRSGIVWSSPFEPGSIAPLYDLLRADTPADFVTAAVCAATNATATSSSDEALPTPGRAFYYLARAESGCASGIGPLGTGTDGVPRAGRTCP